MCYLQMPLSVALLSLASTTRGRPKTNVNTSSRTTKYRKSEELSVYDINILLLASVKSAKSKNDSNMAYVLNFIHKIHLNANGDAMAKIRRFIEAGCNSLKPKKLEPVVGLTHLLDNGLTKSQYHNTRLLAKSVNCDIFPSYKEVQQAKTQCRPPAESLRIDELSASLPLQALLNHTAGRLLLLQEDVVRAYLLKSNQTNNELAIKLQVKWGFDGSSNQSKYNQKFASAEFAKEGDDASLFATTIVPLRMSIIGNSGVIIWQNPTPQSTRWCRPLRIQFKKESPELTLQEKRSVENEIAALKPFQETIAGVKVSIYFHLHLTMIDGKVLAVITGTESTQRCCLCKAKPSEFNNLSNISTRFKVHEDTTKFGLSTLHLWIRSLEWMLHVSYRITVKKWQMRGDLKNILAARKSIIQEQLFKRLGIRVDFPCSGGSGNSNSGPVARTAFSKPDDFAEVLGLNIDLVKRIGTILVAVSCQLPLDVDKFSKFCFDTAVFYVENYNWFPMPPSIHKALIHSRDILLANDLPLGMLAEDASESCNKLYRQNRQFHARKVNREKNLYDVFNRALDSSDPIISSNNLHKRMNGRRRRKCIPQEVRNLLKAPEISPNEEVDECEDSFIEMLEEATEELDDILLPEDPYYDACC